MEILSSLPVLFVFTLVGVLPTNNVVINEIAWMGTEISANDEWIELYNNTELPINLAGWVLRGINLTGIIPAQGFYLLERTDDKTVPDIPADQIYTGALNNNGENLELYDSSGNLIDSANCQAGWLAGDNSTKQTMERKDANAWQTSQNPGGTPKAKNSEIVIPTKPGLTETKPNLVEEEVKKEVAAVSEQIPQKSSFPLLVPVLVAIFSGIVIFFLKKKVQDIDLL